MPVALLEILSALSIPESELRFRTSRSGGPGGQNVNKVETKVELLFDVARSPSLSDGQRTGLLSELAGRIDSKGILHIASQHSRSQWENRERVIEKFVELIRRALTPKRKRIATRPTKSAKERRLTGKRIHSQKKHARRSGPRESGE